MHAPFLGVDVGWRLPGMQGSQLELTRQFLTEEACECLMFQMLQPETDIQVSRKPQVWWMDSHACAHATDASQGKRLRIFHARLVRWRVGLDTFSGRYYTQHTTMVCAMERALNFVVYGGFVL